MKNRITIVVGASVALLVAGYAIRKLVMDKDFRKRLGWDDNDSLVDASSEDSFPASDAPSSWGRSGDENDASTA